MKIAMIGMTKLRFMPYLEFYLRNIDMNQHDIHVIYWNRDEMQDSKIDSRIQLHCHNDTMSDALPLKEKVPHFIQFRKFALLIINKEKFDFLIVHYSTTAILLYNTLLSKYKNRFILDYRDITYENIRLYRFLLTKIARNAKCVFVSSDRFRACFRDCSNVYTSHNISFQDIGKTGEHNWHNIAEQSAIRISFWGLIRQREFNKDIIDKVGSDKRFELHYYGRAQEDTLPILMEAVSKYTNVFYHGEYMPEEREGFSKVSDIIDNLYDNDAVMTNAVANKYYDGLLFHIPQICNKGSYMAALVEKANVGITVDVNTDAFLDEIYRYVISLDYIRFCDNCEKELSRIYDEIELSNRIIRACFGEIV